MLFFVGLVSVVKYKNRQTFLHHKNMYLLSSEKENPKGSNKKSVSTYKY